MKTERLGRLPALMILLPIYLLATGVGALTFAYLPLSPLPALLLADIAATLTVFCFSLLLRNASVYDPYWSVAPPVILALLLLRGKTSLSALLLFFAILLWAIRLTANFVYTFSGFSYEDWRYRMLREKTGRIYPLINLLGIHLVPTLVVYLALVPAVRVVLDRPAFSPFALIPLLAMLGAVLLQGVSDVLMHRFRKMGKGGFIRCGVWKHSRHPNYLAEILFWYAVALYAAILLRAGPLILVGALANNALFLFVSIPMADKRQARKAGFEEYRRKTRRLFPFPRRAPKK